MPCSDDRAPRSPTPASRLQGFLYDRELTVASLRGAELRWADLSGADLPGASLREAEGGRLLPGINAVFLVLRFAHHNCRVPSPPPPSRWLANKLTRRASTTAEGGHLLPVVNAVFLVLRFAHHNVTRAVAGVRGG